MITTVQKARPEDYIALFKETVSGMWVVYHGGERVGMGGIHYSYFDNRWWGFLAMKKSVDAEGGLHLIRRMRSGLEFVTDDIYVLCDKKNHPSAPRLLRALGFEPTDETNFDLDVWVYRSAKGE